MRGACAAIALLGLLAPAARAAEVAAEVSDITLPLPRPLQAGDRLAVTISVGAIGHRQVVVRTGAGDRVGTISLFAVGAGRPGGTYVIPVPPRLIRDGRLVLRLTITGDGESRPPTSEEVTGIELLQTGP